MHKTHPDVYLFLAEEALRHKFLDTELIIKNRNEMKDFCRENFDNINLQKCFLRLQRIDLDRIIIDMVLNELSYEKRKFILGKYKRNEKFIYLSMELNTSVAQLHCWDREILNEVESLMFYKLTPKDIFIRRRIINMIHILDMRINIFEKNNQLFHFVDRAWLDGLYARRKKYSKLLQIINDCVTNRKENIYNDVVATKIEFPLDNITELSKRCHVSSGGVSRHLKTFMQKVTQYIG